MSYFDASTGTVVANSSADERAGFYKRTYLHVAGAIAAYAVLAQRSLSDQDYGFKLLLPDDAVSLALRAEAIGAWSQSF